MRLRTAVAAVSSFIVVKAVLTWVVLSTWASYPERPGSRHWHVELGPLAEWLAAIATAAAAITALYVAGRDRKERTTERRNLQKTHARLVQLVVHQVTNKGASTFRHAISGRCR